jgi:hypothetical protein
MSSKRQSQFLLIRVSQGGFRRFALPVPLYVLDLTLDAFSDLAALADTLAPKWKGGLKRFDLGVGGRSGSGGPPRRLSVERVLALVLALFRELRRHGRLRVVEVQAGKMRVSIDLY